MGGFASKRKKKKKVDPQEERDRVALARLLTPLHTLTLSKPGECTLCLDETEVYTVHEVHQVCKPCMEQLLENKVKHFGVEPMLRCPLLNLKGEKCQILLSRHTFLALGISSSNFQKFAIEERRMTRACPLCLSPAPEHPEREPPNLSTVYDCKQCRVWFCTSCDLFQRRTRFSRVKHRTLCNGLWLGTLDGDFSLPGIEPEDLALLMKAAGHGWQCCPVCQMLVSRSSGCSIMSHMCPVKHSKVSFCYTCGQNLTHSSHRCPGYRAPVLISAAKFIAEKAKVNQAEQNSQKEPDLNASGDLAKPQGSAVSDSQPSDATPSIEGSLTSSIIY